jgi:hypothetical protein
MKTCLAIALPGLAFLLSACAQVFEVERPPRLAPGQRVRVTIPRSGMKKHVATLIALSADTIVLASAEPGDSTRWIAPLRNVGYFEVSRGIHGAAETGAVIGFVAGGALGYWAMKAERDACNGATQGYWPFCSLDEPVLGLISGGLVGAGVGALTGLFIRSERWEHIPLRLVRRIRVGLSPQPDGRLGLGAALTF